MKPSHRRIAAGVVVLLTCAALPSDADVLRKRFGRKFPTGWCPMQNDLDGTEHGIRFQTGPLAGGRHGVTVRFVAEAWDPAVGSVWGHRIDSLVLFEEYEGFEDDFTSVLDCNGNFGDPGGPLSYVFDSTRADELGKVVFREDFDEAPSSRWTGIWQADGSIAECDTFDCSDAPLPAHWIRNDSQGDPPGGGGSLGFGRPADAASGDESKRLVGASFTVVGLEPDTDYVLTGWWSFEAGEDSPIAVTVTQGPTTLLVDDDDDAPDVLPYYDSLLASLGLPYTLFDSFPDPGGPYVEPTLACPTDDDDCLEEHEVVIWFSGDKYEDQGLGRGPAGPTAAAEAELEAFLELGSCVAIVSQDYLFDNQDVLTDFMKGPLGVACGTSDVFHTSVSGAGDLFGGLPGPYPLELPPGFDFWWTDQLTPVGSSGDLVGETAFTGDSVGFCAEGPADAAVDGFRTGSLQYRTLYLGFPLELIPEVRDRRRILARFLDACDATCPPSVEYHTDLEDETVTSQRTVYACNSIAAGEAFQVGATGDLTLRAHNVVMLEPGFSVADGGRLTVAAGTSPRVAAPELVADPR